MANLKMKTVVLCCAVAAGFAGGVAVGRWTWPGGDVGGAAKVEENVAVEADGSSTAEVGGAREGEDESEGVTVAANAQFPERRKPFFGGALDGAEKGLAAPVRASGMKSAAQATAQTTLAETDTHNFL